MNVSYSYDVEEPEVRCEAAVLKRKGGLRYEQCRKKGTVRFEGRTYCPLHVGMFVTYGELQLHDGMHVYDVARSETDAFDGYREGN